MQVRTRIFVLSTTLTLTSPLLLLIDAHAIYVSMNVYSDKQADVDKDKFKLEWMELPRPELQANGIEVQHLFEGDPNYTTAISTLSSKPFPYEIK